MTNVEALKSLYHALGGDLDDVADVNTIVGMLNAISAKFDGADDAELNAQGIANITEIIGNITADLTTLDVTPTTEAQNIKPTAPIDGYNEVNVSAVTAAIDQNITAGNIKKDIQILGVTGSYEGSGGETFAVTITLGDNITADKTYSEIMTAINADSKVTFTITVDGESLVSPGYYVFINEDNVSDKRIMVAFQSWIPSGKIATVFFGINSNNEIQTITMEELTQP